MKTLRIFIALLSATALLMSCRNKTGVDRFYTDHGDWDDVRIPFIKPYEAICLNGQKSWGMNLEGKDFDTGLSDVKSANVVNGVILIYCTNSILHGVDVKQSWRIIIPGKHIEKGFATHQEYTDHLTKLGIKAEPKLYDIDVVFKYFDDNDSINWQDIK